MKYRRVNKTQARKLYFNGSSILLLPCKVSIENALSDNSWVKPIEISFMEEKNYKDYNASQFDFKVNDFEYFNCTDAQLGRYAHYYVSVEDLEKQAMCDMMCS